jgi:hypothetical protein
LPDALPDQIVRPLRGPPVPDTVESDPKAPMPPALPWEERAAP